jgi:hypothetical protein
MKLMHYSRDLFEIALKNRGFKVKKNFLTKALIFKLFLKIHFNNF